MSTDEVMAVSQRCSSCQNTEVRFRLGKCTAKERCPWHHHDELVKVLEAMLKRYVGMVESGDCGFWNAEEEPVVVAARAVLAKVRP